MPSSIMKNPSGAERHFKEEVDIEMCEPSKCTTIIYIFQFPMHDIDETILDHVLGVSKLLMCQPVIYILS